MTVEFEDMKDVVNHLEIRNKCLKKYSQRKPCQFLQLDHLGVVGGWSLSTPWELMQGKPVRVLINGDVADKKSIVEMLQDIARWIEADESIDDTIRGLGDPTNRVIYDGYLPF